MDEIQKVYQKNKRVIEEAKGDLEMSTSFSPDMLDRISFLTLRMRGEKGLHGKGPVTSTPHKVRDKRGFENIDEGGGGVVEKSPRQSKSPPLGDSF